MPKIKKILVLQDLPLRLLGQLDNQLNDLFYHFEGDLDDLENYLTEKRFIIALAREYDLYILDCEEVQLEDYDLEDYDLDDPENLLEDADSFTIKEYQELFSSSVLIESIREKITELLEVPYDLRAFGEVEFNG